MVCWMLLCEVISVIFDTRAPVYEKVILFYLVSITVDYHINSLGFLLLNGEVDDYCGSKIV